MTRKKHFNNICLCVSFKMTKVTITFTEYNPLLRRSARKTKSVMRKTFTITTVFDTEPAPVVAYENVEDNSDGQFVRRYSEELTSEMVDNIPMASPLE